MKARNLILTAALCFAGAALSFADNPNMGTWKLNEAKSKIPAGAPKNTTVVYEAAGDSVKVTTDGTDRDGKPVAHGVDRQVRRQRLSADWRSQCRLQVVQAG